jgi:alkylated DNA repair protein (DNA oxidative demethylase)
MRPGARITTLGGMTGVLPGLEELGWPDGLRYEADFVTEDEERRLLAAVEAIEFRPVTMRGKTARRTVRQFGLRYDYESWRLVPADPLPDGLVWLRDRCAALAGLGPDALEQALVTRYPPGATIGWHRDAPVFGPAVVGVSLAAACRLRLARGSGDAREVAELTLAPRSAYVLAGEARAVWRHSIPPTRALRYSVTFRTRRHGR